jgi:hypothetical protein
MSERVHRKKILLFFIAISLFGYFLYKKTKDVKTEETFTSEYIIEEDIQETNDNILAQSLFFEVDEDLNPVKEVNPQMVLSATDDTNCEATNLVYSSSTTCYQDSGSTEADMTKTTTPDVGTVIKKDANIRLTSIVVPPIFSGSRTMDTNVKQIHRDSDGDYHWTLKPAGEIISKDMAKSNTYAGDTDTQGYLDEAESATTVPYGIMYNIKASGNATGGGDNELTISQYYPNDCSEKDRCDNAENPTPEKSNKISEMLFRSEQYAGYEESDEIVNAGVEACDTNTEFHEMDISGTSPIACTPTLKQLFISFTKKITDAFDANACSPDDEDNEACVSTADIVVIIESPWGNKKDCLENGTCLNAFNESRNANFKYAGQDGYGDVYVLTDCTASIDGAKDVALKCAWDISYISDEVEFQSVDNIPGEDYPDREDYVKFHITESENRTEEPLTM